MGLRDLFKKQPKKSSDPFGQPGLKTALTAMELEYLQKQVANLVSVGRADHAQKVMDEFIAKYVRNSDAPTASRVDLARISYSLAYRELPRLVYTSWNEFIDLWKSAFPFPIYLALKGSSNAGKTLTVDQFSRFLFYQGNLTTDVSYFLLEFPIPPDPSEGPTLESYMAILDKGGKPRFEDTPVLGPYFACVTCHGATNSKHVFILSQNSDGSSTTLRHMSAEGANGNWGPGSPPNAADFLQSLVRHVTE